MFERFAPPMREAVFLAVEEAGRRGDRRVFTDHLLVAALHDPAIAQTVGAAPDAARHAADQLDREALAAIGFDAGAFGPQTPAARAARLPFTPGAKTVLKRTLAHASTAKARRVESRHLLEALLERETPDPAAELLAALHH